MERPARISLNASGRSKHGQLFVLVDQSDHEDLVHFGWTALRNPRSHTIYARRSLRNADGSQTTVLMHRLLMPNADQVDHINGNGLDNRRSNLRPATQAENQRNRRGPQTNNTSGYIGVCWSERSGKWRAAVRVNGRPHHLGLYPIAEEAARARDAAAIEQYGEFARLNFPPTI